MTNLSIKKIFSIILCLVLVLSLAISGAGCTKKEPTGNKKPSFDILTEEEVKDNNDVEDDVLEDVDKVPDTDIGFVDESKFDAYKTDYVLSINNKASVNDTFMGFGAVYYPWLYWNDGAGRNYTEEQRQIELNRLVESGTTWIRSVIYARPEWYDSDKDEWKYEGDYYDGLVKFFKEIDKRGVEVMLNFEWGGSITPTELIFENSVLNAFPKDRKIKMYGTFCTSFLQALKNEGINCVKYITLYSEPSNRKEYGVFYEDPEFQTVHVAKIIPLYTSLLKSVNDCLVAEGIRKDYKIVGNNQASAYHYNSYTWQQFKPMFEATKQYLDEYSYHFYNYLSNPKGYTYDGFASLTEQFVAEMKEKIGISANDTWFDEVNVAYMGNEGPYYELQQKYGTGIYALKDDAYTATQMGNTLLAMLNGGYKTAAIWTFTNNLWPDNTTTGSSFLNGTFLCGMMPNLMDSQVPYNAYYTYSVISRYCTNAKAIYAGDNTEADGMATSCVYDKDGNITVYVVNSNLFDVEYKVNFEKYLGGKVLYRHMYDPATFESNTAAKPIGVDRVLINVDEGFIDKIPAGAVVTYTTSKK